ncbi:MAG: tryptophan--tRNA ligase, partial [Gammaproteobacteria bacterium]|nr:tryptophan--tRNA ligase [Gammaproteobacteria bacterium]
SLSEPPESIDEKLRKMPTDTNRVRLTDPGDPAKCPVWQLHEVYSDESVQSWVKEGCTSAGIGCLDCKAPIIEAVQKELAPLRERAQEYMDDPSIVKNILKEGAENARVVAKETMVEVRQAMGLSF